MTEHLYAVIHQNEMRKAKKLAELMGKLEMEGAEDIEELRELSVPHLTLLNQVSVSHSQGHGAQSPTSPTAEGVNQPPQSDTSSQPSAVSATTSPQTESSEPSTTPTSSAGTEHERSEEVSNISLEQSKSVNNNVDNATDGKISEIVSTVDTVLVSDCADTDKNSSHVSPPAGAELT